MERRSKEEVDKAFAKATQLVQSGMSKKMACEHAGIAKSLWAYRLRRQKGLPKKDRQSQNESTQNARK